MILRGSIQNKIHEIEPTSITKIIKGSPTLSIIGGEFAIASDDSGVSLETLLGSCVAVMFYDPVQRIRAINHFLLPGCTIQNDSYRFGLFSLEEMINTMLKLGCKKERLHAKIAGGARILTGELSDVGYKNVEFARTFCLTEKIPIDSEHVYGFHGRVVLVEKRFETFVRQVENSQQNEQLAKEDQRLREQALCQSNRSRVTLF